MTFTEKNLGQSTVGTTVVTLYTVPSGKTGLVKDIHITNLTSSEVTVSLWLDPNGTSATDSEAIFKDFGIPANDFLHWSGFKVMSENSTIKAQAGTASGVTITIDGAEV